MNAGHRMTVLNCLAVCIATATVFGENSPRSRNLIFNLQGNIYHGSIVGRNRVDGVSGATKTGHGLSGGVEYNLNGHHLQADVTFGWSKQTTNYGPPAEAIAQAGPGWE